MPGCSEDTAARIAAQVVAVRAEIAAACARSGRDPTLIRLIAVTKAQDPAVLPALAAAGITDVGENRLDHLQDMRQAAPSLLRFHGIGRLQSRQLPLWAEHCVCLHGLCAEDHAQRLDRACAEQGRTLEVFLQVNVSGELAKAGIAPTAIGPLLTAIRSLPRLSAIGLMTMAPQLPEGADPATLRPIFRALRDLARQHGLPRLSMGMSQDFTVAIEEGATDLRIGTRLFV
jgi:pyridoxal phosphate enzyme (YggS family)